MSFSISHESSDTWKNQLSLQFSQNFPQSPRTQIADHVDAITSWKFTFHPEKSEIHENRFVLKISYMGRSYSLEWVYKKEIIRSQYERNESDIIFRFVSFKKPLAYHNGNYSIPTFLPKTAYDEIIRNAHNILSGSYYNSSVFILK